MFDFQKLEIYKKAKHFHSNSISQIADNQFGAIVNDQLKRASLSIVLNIAEGSGRFSRADRRHFFAMARSSVFECVAIWDVLKDHDQVTEELFNHQLILADELSRMLYSMIKNLSKQ